jgi:GTP-binding protein Era
MVRDIGTAARAELERELDRRIHLDLHVKVKADWRNNERLLDEIAAQNREEE